MTDPVPTNPSNSSSAPILTTTSTPAAPAATPTGLGPVRIIFASLGCIGMLVAAGASLLTLGMLSEHGFTSQVLWWILCIIIGGVVAIGVFAVAVDTPAARAKKATADAAKSKAAFTSATLASYVGGHPGAPKGGTVRIGMESTGVTVYSDESGAQLFSIPWATIARVQHVLVPKGQPMDQSSATIALYGATGRGGAAADWAAALGGLNSMIGRDRHLVTLIIRTSDNFEGDVVFESKGGEALASKLTAERLRHGQQAAPTPQPQAPGAGDVATRIRELSSLRDAGVITEEEFAATKARLLGQM